MKKSLFLAVLLPLLAASCGKARIDKYVRVSVPPIPDGEVLYYRILSEGEPAGIFRMVTEYVTFRDTPTMRVDIVAHTSEGDIPVIDSSVLFVTRDSMVPLSTFRFVKTGNALVTTATNYTADAAAVATFTPQEEKRRALPFGPQTYDSDQITFLGRALKVPSNRPVEFKVVSPMGPPFGGGVLEGQIGTALDERVASPAGTFDCYKLVLSMGPHILALWYEKTGSHRMVRYQSGAGGLAMELLPGGPAGLRAPGIKR